MQRAGEGAREWLGMISAVGGRGRAGAVTLESKGREGERGEGSREVEMRCSGGGGGGTGCGLRPLLRSTGGRNAKVLGRRPPPQFMADGRRSRPAGGPPEAESKGDKCSNANPMPFTLGIISW